MIMPVWVQISKCPTHNCSLIAHPGEGELVIGPVALGDDRHLVLAGAFERQIIVGGDILDHRERIVPGIDDAFEEGHAVSTLPCEIPIRGGTRAGTRRYLAWLPTAVSRRSDPRQDQDLRG
jgi:hypothetical protein